MNWVKPLHLLVIFIIINVVTSSVDDINEELRDEMQSARRLAENAVNSYSAAWRPYQYTTKKQAKIDRIVDNIKAKPNQLKAVVSSVSPIHNYSSNAIFSSAMDSTYLAREAINFIGTVRKTGYNGDIVVAVLPESENTLIKQLLDYKVIVYTVPIKCSGKINSIFCSTKLSSNLIPATMVKYYLFQYWATLYSDASQVLVSDFRDVIFQSNPFKYKTNEWLPSYNLQVFQEHHPNRVINRCGFNKAWIFNCYGFDALKMIGSNTISSAGVTLGTSRGIAVYSFLMTQQLDPKVRLGSNGTDLSNKGCYSSGFDQGVHNWLLYSGLLGRYLDIKVVQQGEGAVNTLGGFHGDRKILRASLSDWKILRGESPYQYVYNWNGEISPVVHQLDRYLTTELIGGYRAHLACFHNL